MPASFMAGVSNKDLSLKHITVDLNHTEIIYL